MGFWIKGDLHVHSNCCWDGSLPVEEIVRRSRPYCDFLAISGHARQSEDWGREQYRQVVDARRAFPDVPIFHSGEVEFPIERHAMFFTRPGNREFELQKELVARYDRRSGVTGPEKAREELDFAWRGWGPDCFMVFNHPNAPDADFAALSRLAAHPAFRVIACYDRGERRAPQLWDIGAEWDAMLTAGHRIHARFGSDFHRHFADGGEDYYPGEFAQDRLYVNAVTYGEIVNAYRTGNFFASVADMVSEPVFRLDRERLRLKLAFRVHVPIREVRVVCDGICVREFRDVENDFDAEFPVPAGRYYRVRGIGKPLRRKYSAGEYEPGFLFNPLFREES